MKWDEIPGWTCGRLLALYDEIAAEMAGGIFVEVGVAYGRSLAYFAEKAAPDVQILGVDSWLVKMGRNSPEQWAQVQAFVTAYDAATWFLCGHEVELCRGNSADVAYALDFSVDTVFLDGSHEYEAVLRDIRAWLPRVKSGGRLCGHDANANYPGVERAVRELLPGAEFRAPLPEDNGWGGVWTWRKP